MHSHQQSLIAGEARMLVLLLDTSRGMWEQLQQDGGHQETQESQKPTPATLMQQLLLFLNTYLMLQEGNNVAVFAVDGTGRSAHSFWFWPDDATPIA